MKRKIIHIDEEKCTGCEMCIPGCPEGAIQMIDGKARLISDLFCDGLGACLGHCPEDAITIEEREAEAYDEIKVIKNIVRQGPNVIRAHLEHLEEHGETDYLNQALGYLKERGIEMTETNQGHEGHDHAAAEGKACGCMGSKNLEIKREHEHAKPEQGTRPSELTHWPIQLHLISPAAKQFRGAEVLLAADCTAFSVGDFHRDHLKGKALIIACPKLDDGRDVYLQKLIALIEEAGINTLNVMIMQVPCCSGLVNLALEAVGKASRKVPVKATVVGVNGEILREEWVNAGATEDVRQAV